MILALLAACLPHGAASRPAAEAYAYTLQLGEAPYRLTRQYVRTFEDGSDGWLVCVAPTAAPTDENCAELRTFSTGEVLVVRGWLAWPAPLRVATVGLWPVVSPRVDTAEGFVAGWPAGKVGRDAVRLVGRGPWTRSGSDWAWAPAVSLSGPAPWTLRGTYTADLRLDRGDLARGAWRLGGEVCDVAGACRAVDSVGRLDRAGVTAPRDVAPCPDAEVAPSRAPLCLGSARLDDPSTSAVPLGF